MATSLKRLLEEAPDLSPEIPRGRTATFPLACALLLGALLVAEAMLRPRAGSPDAYQYLDVAANLAEGRGLVQSVPGYNAASFPAEPAWPQPFTSQPPLYPWLASLAIRMGAEPTAALASLAAAGTVVTWLAGAGLALWLWGEAAGVLSLLGLVACSLTPTLTARVWSDPLAIGLSMCSLLALLPAGRADPARRRWAYVAGACAGLAFLTRYVFGLLLPFSVLWLLCVRPFASRWRQAAVFGATWLALSLSLLIRNLATSDGALGEPRNPSTQDLGAFLSNALRFTWGRVPDELRWLAVIGILAALVAVFVSRERNQRLRDALAAGSGLVLAWALAYTLALVALRLRVHFDNVGVRLLSPALVAAALLAAGIAALVVRPPRTLVSVSVSIALLVAAGNVALRIVRTPTPARIEDSRGAFMQWLARATPPGAVLVAEDGVDFAWALRGEPRRIVSFSPAPYMRPLTRGDLERLVRRNVYAGAPPLRVIVRGEEADDAGWRQRYGDLIADAVAGVKPTGDGLVLERVLDGKRILRWRLSPRLRARAAPAR
jgi:hypothetical protein